MPACRPPTRLPPERHQPRSRAHERQRPPPPSPKKVPPAPPPSHQLPGGLHAGPVGWVGRGGGWKGPRFGNGPRQRRQGESGAGSKPTCRERQAFHEGTAASSRRVASLPHLHGCNIETANYAPVPFVTSPWQFLQPRHRRRQAVRQHTAQSDQPVRGLPGFVGEEAANCPLLARLIACRSFPLNSVNARHDMNTETESKH